VLDMRNLLNIFAMATLFVFNLILAKEFATAFHSNLLLISSIEYGSMLIGLNVIIAIGIGLVVSKHSERGKIFFILFSIAAIVTIFLILKNIYLEDKVRINDNAMPIYIHNLFNILISSIYCFSNGLWFVVFRSENKG
jgi:hypothetical protein